MRIRSSETGTHDFADQLVARLSIGEVQGLLIDANGEFSCSVECIELEKEDEKAWGAFTPDEWRQKVKFSRALGVPFYVFIGKLDKSYDINQLSITKNGAMKSTSFKSDLNVQQVAEQWAAWKGTRQTKALNEAAVRVNRTLIDGILDQAGLSWGGNIDGFLLRDDKVIALMEFRFTGRGVLETYDPQKWFFHRGGDYGTWRPLMMAKDVLKVPLILLTFEKPNRVGCGIAEIVAMTSNAGITYASGPPGQSIASTLQDADKKILSLLP